MDDHESLKNIAVCLSRVFVILYHVCHKIELHEFDVSTARKWWGKSRRSALDSEAAAVAATGYIMVTK